MRKLTRTQWIGASVGVAVVMFFLLGSIMDSRIDGTNQESMNTDRSNAGEGTLGEGNAPSSEAGASASAGPAAGTGSLITVHYVGKLQNGQIFDSSRERGTPFSFVLGIGQVIQGWDQGLMGAKKGDKRTLVIPPSEAYGRVSGHPLQNETLIFDVEVIEVAAR